MPPGSPVFPSNSVLIALYWSSGKVVTAPLGLQTAIPILANAQDVLQQLGHADGACMDPVTGDFLFGSFNAQGQLIRVSGFEAPTPTPTATVTPTPPATATATPSATATAKTTRDTTSVALASITLNPGNLTGGAANSTGTVTLSAAAPAGGAVVDAGEQQTRVRGCRPRARSPWLQGRQAQRSRSPRLPVTVRHQCEPSPPLTLASPNQSGSRREHAAGFVDAEPFLDPDRRRRTAPAR